MSTRPVRAPSRRLFTIAAASFAATLTAPAHAAGAITPFTSLEAEAGKALNGAQVVALTAPPATRWASPELEASGHAYVALTATGQEIRWTNTTGQPITFVTVRASIPDAPAGGGITETLNLYVDGVFRQHLDLNSRQTWIYEGQSYQAQDNDPSKGRPRAFFDEASAFVAGAPIAPGSTFSLRRDADNTAAFYDIDVVDVENPPPPRAQPAGSIAITSCGAVPDTQPTNGMGNPAAADSTAAIRNCIAQAQSQGRSLWIPPGIFYLKGTGGLAATGITIEGAGMWYSTVYRDVPLPNATPLGAVWQLVSTTLRDVHTDSNARSRDTVDGAGGAMDVTGTNWLSERLWTQHVLSGCWASGTGGTVRDSRFTTIWADGCNFNNVSMGASVGSDLASINNFVRGTGDDAMAINSVAYNDTANGRVTYSPMTNVTFSGNTLIGAWNGKGLAVYGGSGHTVTGNLVADTARYIGLGAGRFGVNGSDLHDTRIVGNRVERAGGNGFDQGQPAVQVGNGGDGQQVGVVDNVTLSGNTIVGALFDGIGFSTSTSTHLDHNTVIGAWRDGISVAPPFFPAPTGSAQLTANAVSAVAAGRAAFVSNSNGFAASASQDSWQVGGAPTPFHGKPVKLPATLAASDYDLGGAAIAFNALSVNGTANGYRADGVDLEASGDADGGLDLGWTASGQWFRYSVKAPSAGVYKVSLRVSSPAGARHAFHVADAAGRDLSGAIDVPATNGWQAWTTVTAKVRLVRGVQVLGLMQDASGWNLHTFSFAQAQ